MIREIATVVRAEERIALDILGPKIEPLTPYQQESYCLIKGTLPAGVVVPIHSHTDAESFYVLSGEAEALLQTESGLTWRTVRRGDFVHIPGGTKHAWRNESDFPAEVMVATTARLGHYLREISTPVNDSAARFPTEEEMSKLAEITKQYGYWLAGPEENASLGISLFQNGPQGPYSPYPRQMDGPA